MFNISISQISESKSPSQSFLQTPFWGEFKSRHGWNNQRFSVTYVLNSEEDESNCDKTTGKKSLKKSLEISVLNRSFARGLFSISYIPLMPDLPFECTPDEIIERAFEDNENQITAIDQEIITPETQTIEFASLLTELGKALKPYLPKNTIVIRYDPFVYFSKPDDRDTFNFGMKTVSFADHLKLKKNRVDIQPPDSTLIDLTGNEEEILNNMHQKWRYNIRLSERKGVVIHKYLGNSINLSEKLDVFYNLTKITNERDGNSSHSRNYYLDLIKFSSDYKQNHQNVPLVSLYIAEHEGDEIASIITLFNNTEAVYLYGASANTKRNLMPNHLLQWTAMKDAKAYGCQFYDMYGMPPEGKDEKHPMHGLYLFKANFGGKQIHYTGSWDLPLKPVYHLYNFAERIRAFWYKKIIKKLKGR